MVITKRYKNQYGETIGYDICDCGNTKYIPLDIALGVSSLITNAIVKGGKEYVATRGNKIETVIRGSDQKRIPVKTKKQGGSLEGVSFYGKDYIGICRKIRNYAVQGKVKVDMSEHSLNKESNHLLLFIKACGYNVKDFLCSYLSCVQPYSLTRFQYNNTPSNSVWLLDLNYSVTLVIKILYKNSDEELLVSFHENRPRGGYIRSNKDFSKRLCGILIEDFMKVNNTYRVKTIIPKGFINYNLELSSKYVVNDLALVSYSDIDSLIMSDMESVCNNLLELYSDNNSIVNLGGTIFSRLSFSAYGYHTLNNLSMLIDIYPRVDNKNKRIAVVQVAMSILCEIPVSRVNNTKNILIKKYGKEYNNKLLKAITEY